MKPIESRAATSVRAMTQAWSTQPIAIRAASAIGIRFGSIDVVRAGGAWQILEVNAGVKMEALSRSHPELAYAAYEVALDKVFA